MTAGADCLSAPPAREWPEPPEHLRILLLCHSFNSLSQRLFSALVTEGHQVSVELDISDAVTEEAVALFRPDLLIAPFLKRRITDAVWRAVPCFVVHPGPPGDRGPAALDWAVLAGEAEWGVTVLQASGEFDAGPVWASATFPLRAASKGDLYRAEVTDAATRATRLALERFRAGQSPAVHVPQADGWPVSENGPAPGLPICPVARCK